MEETSSEKKQQQKEYEQYVKEVTPTHNLWLQMLEAFIVGGIICCIGQGILNYVNERGYIVPGLGDAGDRIFGTK